MTTVLKRRTSKGLQAVVSTERPPAKRPALLRRRRRHSYMDKNNKLMSKLFVNINVDIDVNIHN